MISGERISRFLSFLLRHNPKEYGLKFDARGFVEWGELFSKVQERFPDITEEELLQVIKQSDKKRFEFADGKVRATYGHSFQIELGLESAEPPGTLYYGTARDLAENILRAGLKPRDRRFVHLTPSVDDALASGRRRDPFPALIAIDARAAHAGGVQFHQSGPLFLVKEIPPRFLSLLEQSFSA
jgi:putative RNA 2'-phosphotransferase